MNIVGDLLRGHTDAIILSILKKEDNYGYRINQQIESLTKGTLVLTEATLYTVFKRLESKALISAYWQDGTHGVKRKYYSITKNGKAYLEDHKLSWTSLKEIMDTFMIDN